MNRVLADGCLKQGQPADGSPALHFSACLKQPDLNRKLPAYLFRTPAVPLPPSAPLSLTDRVRVADKVQHILSRAEDLRAIGGWWDVYLRLVHCHQRMQRDATATP